ncbi:MAG: hypothetical protein QW687_02125 [Candidatus Hadarchaeales archaeon]
MLVSRLDVREDVDEYRVSVPGLFLFFKGRSDGNYDVEVTYLDLTELPKRLVAGGSGVYHPLEIYKIYDINVRFPSVLEVKSSKVSSYEKFLRKVGEVRDKVVGWLKFGDGLLVNRLVGGRGKGLVGRVVEVLLENGARLVFKLNDKFPYSHRVEFTDIDLPRSLGISLKVGVNVGVRINYFGDIGSLWRFGDEVSNAYRLWSETLSVLERGLAVGGGKIREGLGPFITLLELDRGEVEVAVRSWLRGEVEWMSSSVGLIDELGDIELTKEMVKLWVGGSQITFVSGPLSYTFENLVGLYPKAGGLGVSLGVKSCVVEVSKEFFDRALRDNLISGNIPQVLRSFYLYMSILHTSLDCLVGVSEVIEVVGG